MGMVVNGFIEPITRTLPMEYAVEWSRLIELQMEGSRRLTPTAADGDDSRQYRCRRTARSRRGDLAAASLSQDRRGALRARRRCLTARGGEGDRPGCRRRSR